jgi:hypothetical protein
LFFSTARKLTSVAEEASMFLDVRPQFVDAYTR